MKAYKFLLLVLSVILISCEKDPVPSASSTPSFDYQSKAGVYCGEPTEDEYGYDQDSLFISTVEGQDSVLHLHFTRQHWLQSLNMNVFVHNDGSFTEAEEFYYTTFRGYFYSVDSIYFDYTYPLSGPSAMRSFRWKGGKVSDTIHNTANE